MAGKRNGLPAITYPTLKPVIPVFYNNFNTKLPKYSTKYGITAAEVTAIAAHNTAIAQKRDKQATDYNTAQNSTRLYDEELHNAEVNGKRIMNKIVDHSAFLKSDGEDMGFIVNKATMAMTDTAIKAMISGVTSMPDLVRIDWVKSAYDGVQVYTSYDGKIFTKLERDNRSPFEDTRKNRVANTPETRWYKLRYLAQDKEVGQDSDVVKILTEIY